jgi:hypothetical protein
MTAPRRSNSSLYRLRSPNGQPQTARPWRQPRRSSPATLWLSSALPTSRTFCALHQALRSVCPQSVRAARFARTRTTTKTTPMLMETPAEAKSQSQSRCCCGEIYVTDWIAQGDNMKNAVAGDSVALRIVKRPNFKPAVQVLKKDEPFTYCWLQPAQCAMIIPLIEGGSAQIDGQWMRAASASGVRLALMLRVSLVGTQVDASKRVFAKTSTEIAAWTSLAQMLRTSPAVLLSNPGIARKSQDLLHLTTSQVAVNNGSTSTESEAPAPEHEDVQQSELDKLMELTRMDVVPIDPPASITVTLHHYQKEGLGWLVSREASAGEAPGQFEKRQKTGTESDLPAGWEARKGPTGKVYYHNTITGVSYTQHPASRAPLNNSSAASSATSNGNNNKNNRPTNLAEEVAACGGILADDM